MSDCCETIDGGQRRASCPVTRTSGTRVRLLTVKALLTDVSLRRFVSTTTYYFCPEPSCAVVYFSTQGELYATSDLRTPVWQKEPPGQRLLCYCFGETEQSIASEITTTGASTVLQRVTEHVRAKRCACDIRNPRGECCLGDLKGAVARIQANRARD